MKPGKLYGVGIGPGDPRYLTLRAADVLRSVDVIFTVISQNASSSVSRSVVESLEPRGEIHLQIFSMSREKAVRAAQVQANADAIITELKAGRDCAFATLTAKAGTVLVENGEQLRVIPSFKSEMAETLDFPKGSTTILLKTYRSRKALVERLRREENVEILYGEHLAMEGQTLLTDLDAVADRPEEYLSLIMVKKQ